MQATQFPLQTEMAYPYSSATHSSKVGSLFFKRSMKTVPVNPTPSLVRVEPMLSNRMHHPGAVMSSTHLAVSTYPVHSIRAYAPVPVSCANSVQLRTCRRCGRAFDPADNTATSCRYHPALYTGGERGKAVGFVRESAAAEHQLAAVHGTGLLRFWDCCGASAPDALGCCAGPHASYDDQ